MKLLSVVGIPRWIVAVHAVPAGSPWRSVPLRLPVRLGGVELLVVAFAAAGFLVADVVPVAAYAWWAFLAAPLVVIDLAVHRLPDRLTYCAAIGVWVLLLLGFDVSSWVRSLLSGVAVAGLFAASTLILGRRGFGLGDAKLALSCAALLGWVGWPTVVVGLMVAFVASGLVSAVLLAVRRVRWSTHLPFGPFLVLGTVVGLALAASASA